MTQGSQRVRIRAYAMTDVGRVREQNEDSLFKGATAFAVADGMGGHQAGEVASETALRPIAELDGVHFERAEDAERALVEAVRAANRNVVEKAESTPSYRGMGTTLTAVLMRDGQLHVAHVGDSRAYLLRPGQPLEQLTTDHTLVEQLVREGRLSRDAASKHPQRGVVTRAIGVERDVQVDTLPPLRIDLGDQMLLCSDGLSGQVSDERIAEILATTDDGDEACKAMIAAANDAGGPDNTTVVLLRTEQAGETAAATSRSGARQEAASSGSARSAAEHTRELPGEPAADRPVTRIRTREESGQDWASSMGRYGAPQGVEQRAAPEPAGGGLRRALAAVLAAVVLLGVTAGGGYFLLSRSYFVGVAGGQVAIYNGLPQDVAGFPLHWVAEETDVAIDALPPIRQERVREGLTVGTLGEARRLIQTLRSELADQQEPAEAGQPETPGPDDEQADAAAGSS